MVNGGLIDSLTSRAERAEAEVERLRRAVEDEREACARVALNIWDRGLHGTHGGEQANRTAAAIRTRARPYFPAPERGATSGTFSAGDRVEKVGGDYGYSGLVVAVVVKRSGAVRYVVEDERGLLFIFSAGQLRRSVDASPTSKVV